MPDGTFFSSFPRICLVLGRDPATLVATNDRRALHAVWRNDTLWMTTTINPKTGAFPATLRAVPDPGVVMAQVQLTEATSK